MRRLLIVSTKPLVFEVLPAHDPPPFLVKWPTIYRPETAALGQKVRGSSRADAAAGLRRLQIEEGAITDVAEWGDRGERLTSV